LGAASLKVNAVLGRDNPFCPPKKIWTEDHVHETGNSNTGFFFTGKILYKDGNRENRRLGFIRRFDNGTDRFRPLPTRDTDYEYDD
jgi:hypothetical protein